jgi:serine/threonine protein phosphatase PrpC
MSQRFGKKKIVFFFFFFFFFSTVSFSGLEVSDSTLEFAFVCDDTLTVRFRCSSLGEARFWVHCIQRAVLHCAASKRKQSSAGARRSSAFGAAGGGGGAGGAGGGGAGAAHDAADAVRRHTLGGQSASWKFSKTNTFCGSMFEVYSALETGRRRTMEDECVIVHDVNAEFGLDTALYPPQALFALYDGHSGRGAVDFAVQHMNRLLLAATASDARALPRSSSSCSSGSSVSLSASSASQIDSASLDDDGSPPITPKTSGAGAGDPLLLVRPAVALRSAFLQCDEQFRKQACEEGDVSGTTAIVALLRARRLFVANAGDSRAVLCRNARALDLSTDHKPTPSLTDDIRRIEDAGGWITAHEVLNVPKLYALGLDEDELDEEAEELVGWVTVRRVNGVLGMTRSLGDILIKDWRDQQFEDAEFKEGAELVVADPEVLTHEIQSGDEFFLIASDGLWDVFSSQDAVDFVRKHDDRSRAARQYLVQELVNEAMERGSIDNISVLLVFFNGQFGAAHEHEGELGVYKSKRQAFSRRFGVLSKADRTLLLYRSRADMLEGKSAVDVLLLQNVKACQEVASPAAAAADAASPAAPSTRFLFQLTAGGTTTLLSAATDAERQRWIALLGSTKLAQN